MSMPIGVLDVLYDPFPWINRQIVIAGDIVGIRPSILVERAEKLPYWYWQEVVSPEEGIHLQFPTQCLGGFTIGGLPIARYAVVSGIFALSTVGLTRYMIADVSEITIGGPLSEFPHHPVSRLTREQANARLEQELLGCVKLGQSKAERAEAEDRIRNKYEW